MITLIADVTYVNISGESVLGAGLREKRSRSVARVVIPDAGIRVLEAGDMKAVFRDYFNKRHYRPGQATLDQFQDPKKEGSAGPDPAE